MPAKFIPTRQMLTQLERTPANTLRLLWLRERKPTNALRLLWFWERMWTTIAGYHRV